MLACFCLFLFIFVFGESEHERFNQWEEDILNGSSVEILASFPFLDVDPGVTVIEQCNNDPFEPMVIVGLQNAVLLFVHKSQDNDGWQITYEHLEDHKHSNFTQIICMQHNMIFIASQTWNNQEQKISVYEFHKMGVSPLKNRWSMNFKQPIHAMTACYSPPKSEVFILVLNTDASPSALSISVDAQKRSFSVHQKSITEAAQFSHSKSASLSCTFVPDADSYVVMLDNECDNLWFLTNSFQLSDAMTAYPVLPITAGSDQLNKHDIDTSKIQQWFTPHCIIQIFVSSLHTTRARIFKTDFLDLIRAVVAKPTTNDDAHQSSPGEKAIITAWKMDVRGFIVIRNNDILRIFATFPGMQEMNSDALDPGWNNECTAAIIVEGVKCRLHGFAYSVLSVLGAGAHATVWLANQYDFQLQLVQQVAIKVFAQSNMECYEREQCGMTTAFTRYGRRSIPHLIRLYDSGNGLLILQYVSGGDLLQIMQNPSGFFVRTSRIDILVEFLWQLSLPLSILNDQQQTLHADIKPENILVQNPNGRSAKLEVYLSDLSCMMDYDCFAGGGASGTLMWFSPEMAYSLYSGTGQRQPSSCMDAYGLCLTAMHFYDSLCANMAKSANKFDILCEVAQQFAIAMAEFEQKRRSFHNAGPALNQMFQQRSDAVAQIFTYMQEMPNLRRANRKNKNILTLLSASLQRIPNDSSRYPYVASKPSRCLSWIEWREVLEKQRY